MALESDRLAEGIAPDALDDHDGPAKRLSPGELDAAVSAAVNRALPSRTRFSRRTVQALLIAATLCLAGVSAALIAARASDDDRSPPAPDLARRATPTERTEPRISPAPLHPELAASSEVEAPSEGESGARAPSAADLLKAANELRRQGRWAEAERAYSQVATRYGATGQGPVAALAAASLRLEHLGDPKGALRLYQSALGASSLSAEAELGIANSHRALGDRDAELRTLRRLASAYPNAAFHERVEARLRALETGKP